VTDLKTQWVDYPPFPPGGGDLDLWPDYRGREQLIREYRAAGLVSADAADELRDHPQRTPFRPGRKRVRFSSHRYLCAAWSGS
jgi:hypothetical protein